MRVKMGISRPLGLCRVDRALILATLPMLFYAVGTAMVARDVRAGLPGGPSRALVTSALDWAWGVVAGYALIISLGLLLRRRSPANSAFVYVTMGYFALNTAILATFMGPLSSLPWLSILGLSVVGLLLLTPSVVFTSFALFLLALVAAHTVGGAGRLPYRDIFEGSVPPSWWTQRMAAVTAANATIIVLITAYIVSAWRERERGIRDLSNSDDLTGLGNRRYLAQALRTEFSRAQRYGRDMSYAILDLDHFKRVNDRYGHPTGDEVLKAVARALVATVRESDCVARWGGDEFVILLPETTGPGAAELAERCRTALAAAVAAETGLAVSASVGIASASHEGAHSSEDLVRIADEALYSAKEAGRNRVVIAGASPRESVVSFPRIVSQNSRPNAM